jgi:hypothetical protein
LPLRPDRLSLRSSTTVDSGTERLGVEAVDAVAACADSVHGIPPANPIMRAPAVRANVLQVTMAIFPAEFWKPCKRRFLARERHARQRTANF